jgi:hypothetical protein
MYYLIRFSSVIFIFLLAVSKSTAWEKTLLLTCKVSDYGSLSDNGSLSKNEKYWIDQYIFTVDIETGMVRIGNSGEVYKVIQKGDGENDTILSREGMKSNVDTFIRIRDWAKTRVMKKTASGEYYYEDEARQFITFIRVDFDSVSTGTCSQTK